MRVSVCLMSVMLLAGCSGENARVKTAVNVDATIADVVPNPLQGKVITEWNDPQAKTMSTLFGNDVASGYARQSAEMKYPAGSVISLVTWTQQEDARWFGGRIPSKPAAVEVVSVAASGPVYQRYEGSPLKKVPSTESTAKDRATYLLAQRAAVMP